MPERVQPSPVTCMEFLVALGVITLITVLNNKRTDYGEQALSGLYSSIRRVRGIYLRTKCIFGKNPQDVIDRNSGIIRNLA